MGVYSAATMKRARPDEPPAQVKLGMEDLCRINY